MATSKKKSPMQQIIRESLKEMKQDGGFPQDPTLDDEGQKISGPERFAETQKQKDEIVIDKLLAPIQSKSGYFMKLKKELRPGEWMLMKTIENEWRRWADIETEVAKIVKDHTIKAPGKWGSGPYRIEYGCTTGMRGETYPDIDMHINAEEEYIVNPAGLGHILPPQSDVGTQVAGEIDRLGNLVAMLKNFLPPAADPAKTQEQIAGAFQQGMQLKAQEASSGKDAMATMIAGLMTMVTALVTKDSTPRVVNSEQDGFRGMLETLKTFGVLGQPQIEKPKTAIDFIRELKDLGMDILKKDDPIQQMSQLKALANVASEFMGMGGSGEKPGILEKLVDTLAPVLPGMIKDLKDTATNASQAQIEAGRNIERANRGNVIEQPHTPQGSTINVGTAPMTNPQIAQFFAALYEAVMINNRMFYPVIYTSLLQDAQGQNLLQGIANGTQSAKEVIELLQQHGGEKFRDSEFVMKKLVGYTNGFIIWIRDMMKPKANGASEMTGHEHIRPAGQPRPEGSTSFDAECQLCHTVYAFDNEQQYVNEPDKTCEVEHNGVLCPGLLQPVQRAS